MHTAPNSPKPENISRDRGKRGTRKIVQPVSYRREPAFRFCEKARAFLEPIDPDGASDPDRVLAALRASTRGAHMCARARACASARPRANACTLVIVVHTHVRVVRGVVLRPPPFPLDAARQPPFPPCNWRTSQFPFRSPLLPACPLCYTWSPPVRSVLSPSRGPLPFASSPPRTHLTSRGH